MELWTIGQVAARFGIRASALRYYEELGVLAPVARSGGARRYDRAQLRRVAFVRIGRDLGLPLDGIREVLDGTDHRWRARVDTQLAELAAQAERIRRAQELLTHARECDSAHPITGCPTLIGELDRVVDAAASEFP